MATPILARHSSPTASAYARVTEVLPFLRIDEEAPRSGDGWVTAADLTAAGDALEAYLAAEDARIRQDHGRPARPDVVATFGLHRYAWPACLLVTMPYFLLRRVPRVPLTRVSFHRDLGRMTVDSPSFACLPDDPAAQLPQARVVPDAEALRQEVREAVAAHLGPVLEAFRPRMRRGPHALWGLITDEIVEGLWYVGHLLGMEERAVAEAERLLPGTVASLFPGGASFRTLTGPNGERLTTRDRASCCLYYTLRPENTCVTCPRTCDTERVRRLSAEAA